MIRLKRFVRKYTKNTPLFADLSLRFIASNLLCTVIGQLREIMVDTIYLFRLLGKITPETTPAHGLQ